MVDILEKSLLKHDISNILSLYFMVMKTFKPFIIGIYLLH